MKFPVRMIGAHGAMHAYDTGELERLQKLGWSIEHPEPPVVPVINGDASREPEDVIDAGQALKEALAESMRLDPPPETTEEQAKRKPGRPRKVQ